MKTSLSAAVLIAALMTNMSAPSSAQEVMVGIGTTTCGDYNDLLKRTPKDTPDDLYTEDALYTAWAQGFVSSLNAANVAQKKPMKAVLRIDPMIRAIKLLCSQRPKDTFGAVVSSHFDALPAVGAANKSSAPSGP